MKTEKVFLQGLNYRTPDSEAPAGICRSLQDLYPAGDVQAPMWKPAARPELYYQEATNKIKAAYIWNRANVSSVLVYLATDDRGFGGLYTITVDESGNPKSEAAIKIFTPAYVSINTDASFAQMGDTLVVCITENEKAKDLLVLSVKDGATIIRPFNLTLKEVSINVTYDGTGISSAAYYVCMRAFYRLADGTLRSATTIRVLSLGAKTKLKLSIAAIPTSDISSEILVYISDPKATKTDAIESPIFRSAGVFTDKFSGSGNFLYVDPASDDFHTNEILDEDNLGTHAVYCSNIFSYNKMLIMAGAQYSFANPFKFDGGIYSNKYDSSGGSISELLIVNPSLKDFPFTIALLWKGTFTDSATFIVDIRYERKYDWIFVSGGSRQEIKRSVPIGAPVSDEPQYVQFWTGTGSKNVDGSRGLSEETNPESFINYSGNETSSEYEYGWYQFRIKMPNGDYVESEVIAYSQNG